MAECLTQQVSKNTSGIYCIENLISGKKYIGQSKDIRNRWAAHKSELRLNKHRNSHLQKSWNHYGEQSFSFYVLEECEISQMDEREQYYIQKEKTYISNGVNGYNLTAGGGGSAEENISEEERRRKRESQRNLAKPICQLDFNGNLISVWEYGAREASKTLGIAQSSIWTCVNHKRKTYKGYIWVNKEEYDKGIDITCYVKPIGMKRAVLQYGLDGVFIKRWERASEAAKCLHIDESSIIKACKRKVLYHKDWLWCYEDENYITETYIAGLKTNCPSN